MISKKAKVKSKKKRLENNIMINYVISDSNEILLVNELQKKYTINLRERLFKFAIDTFKILGELPLKREYDVFRQQLSRSATSIGANYEEAQGAYSKKEFASKIGICLKEAKETYYFYRILKELKIGDIKNIQLLLTEADEIQKIFATILLKVKRKK